MQQSQSRGKVLDGLIRLRDSGDVKGIQVNIWRENVMLYMSRT
jgi:hypothetical protein